VKGRDRLVSGVFGEIASRDKLQSGWLVSWPSLNPGPPEHGADMPMIHRRWSVILRGQICVGAC